MLKPQDILIPATVSSNFKKQYIQNMLTATQSTGRLMLFAGDQKVEHFNKDFYGENITPEDNNPEHMFEIASKARIGAFATQFGFIAKYGMDFPNIPYIVKLNSKTNLIPKEMRDPRSTSWVSIGDVLELKRTSKLNIVGVGYTVYLGSDFESEMLAEVARLVYAAQYHGLLTILWMYPRGKAVTNEKDTFTVAGAAAVGAALGADFVKVNYPKADNPAEALKIAVAAAGRTKLICAGGSKEDVPTFLKTLHDQIHIAGAFGSATGRNIHQRPLNEAIRFSNAISAITFDNKSVEDALALYNIK